MSWPLVHRSDDGIRPAGKPDECFYCNQRIGDKHGPECVAVHKKVLVKIEMEIEIEVPSFWDEDAINFHYNEGTWCANNIPELIQEYLAGFDEGQCVLCPAFSAKYLGDSGAEPYGKLRMIPAAKGHG
jgi:hypothetical protein